MRMITRRLLDVPSLDYEVATTPSPLQASPMDSTDPLTTATLTVVASNKDSGTANVAKVAISFDIAPPGHEEDATNLTSIGTGIGFAVMGDPTQAVWTLTNDNAGTLTATAKAGSVPIAGEGLAFILSNIQPNRSVGTFNLFVNETLLDGEPEETTLLVSKFPFQFSLDNFRADLFTVPQPGSTTLHWDGGEGATLKIFYDGAGSPEDVTGKNSWPTPSLTEDSQFVIEASIGAAALATWALTIEVDNQILDLTSLTVDQESTLRGPVSAGSTLAVKGLLTAGSGAKVTGALSASGAVSGASLAVGAATLTGPVSATAGAAVAGELTADTLRIGSGDNSYILQDARWNGPPFIFITRSGYVAPPQDLLSSCYIYNSVSQQPKQANVTGLSIALKDSRDTALGVFGHIVNWTGVAGMARVATSRGDQVYTSPLSRQIELHLHGTGKLKNGRARIRFDRDVRDVMSPAAPYRVHITPAGDCNGLAVTDRDELGFTVRECGGGRSDAAFDWSVIARKRAEPGADEPQELPRLPARPVSPEARGY